VKVIYVIADTLRRDHVSAYGDAPWGKIHTPNLARFASQAAVFEHAYIGSFPTGPNRRDTVLGLTSQGEALNRWEALTKQEVTFPRYLAEKKVVSMLITDTQNTVTRAPYLQRDFTAWAVNRGQEGDECCLDANVPFELPAPLRLIRYNAERWQQILTNRARRRVETDWFAPGTYSMAMDWLERNYTREDFFLWVDTFDPHEPWDPPQHYIDRYDPGFKGRVIEAPPGGFRKKMGVTGRELKQMRARYAGEVTMVDAWFGHMLSKLEQLGILDETMIVFTSDHGTPLAGPGDFDLMRKPVAIGADGMVASAGRRSKQPVTHVPLSVNTTRIPLIIRMPGMKRARRINAIAQPWDVTATILEAFGVPVPSNIIGASLLPLIAGKANKHRDVAISGNSQLLQATTSRWMYSVWAGLRPAALYDLRNDPDCRKDVSRKQPAVARRLHGKIVKFMRGQGLDEEYTGAYRTG